MILPLEELNYNHSNCLPTLPTSSIKITNCIEKQNVPHKSFTKISSIKLWIVELIQRLRCDNKTRNVSGTVVWHVALGTYNHSKIRVLQKPFCV
jgi:hypothetical protein